MPILPGAALGVLGSGQLGRMFAIAARRLGYRVHVLSPDDDTPTGQVADVEVRASYDDLDRVAEFARNVSVVTFEFENVPAATTNACDRHVPVRPGGSVLHTTQHRLREKNFLRAAGLPTTEFAAIDSLPALQSALQRIGAPAVLKTAEWGYDGKGQMKIQRSDDAATAWSELNTTSAILEAFIDFECELSIVAARGVAGDFVSYGPIVNSHSHHILDLSFCPSGLPPQLCDEATAMARTVLEALDVVGVLCVEFFLTRDGRLLINELAPRPHNSGHLTIDSCVTCQFEQQVRAVCGLPLGSPRQHTPAAMANLLGDVWKNGAPNWPSALAMPDIKLHLYGKQEPRAGRKMGHINALGATAAEAAERAVSARNALQRLPK